MNDHLYRKGMDRTDLKSNDVSSALLKRFCLFVFLFSIVCLELTAQKEIIRAAKKINWYGLDFSEARLIGEQGFPDKEVVVNNYVHSKWNAVIFKEQERYNIGSGFPGKSIELYPDVVRDINASLTPTRLITNTGHSLELIDCQRAINRYKSINAEGLSCVFIVESFDKTVNTAYVWVVVFDPFTKKICYAKRYQGRPGGGGVLNFWLGAVRKVIGQMRNRVMFDR